MGRFIIQQVCVIFILVTTTAKATQLYDELGLYFEDTPDYEERFSGEENSGEESGLFSSRLGLLTSGEETSEQGRGIFSYTSKSKTITHGGPPPGQGFHHVAPPFIHHHGPPRGHHPPPPPHHHHHPHHGKVPHYVKYWKQNSVVQHNHKPKQAYTVHHEKNPLFSGGYWTHLAERLADGVGLLPEYGEEKKKNTGHHKHGKYHFKGITLHNGFFTEVL